MTAATYVDKANRDYLSSLNRRIRAGETHLLDHAKEHLVYTGRIAKSFKPQARTR